ncbi:MAG TPA: DNA-directed DNA polymerase [Methanotrichaceae archaeon]|nr:DNA-directed DNA polymerase [Methanotrichaceae archaeon]HQF16706.1 DNA-directed DNA polymerase [Methanotrichaceae archaeon]HQI91282.1 DNA-directed DNA polymerase [Methanotrichaceae archaeon]HQJ28696.1 DNA-directed DNA polymerase [Methanotrichaceae archaeon]
MLFQILDANYVYDSRGWPVVQLFGSTPEGKSLTCRVSGFKPYFYVSVLPGKSEAAKEGLQELGLVVEDVDRFWPIGYQEKPVPMFRVVTKDPKGVRELRERARSVPGVESVFETDILFKNRFLIDTGLGGMGWAQVSEDAALPIAGQRSPLLCRVEDIHPVERESNAPLRYLAFDIECLPKNGEMPTADTSPVILISMAFQPPYRGQEDLVLVGKPLDCQRGDVEACGDESQLLTRFFDVLSDYDPDVLAGYNSNDFDIPYLDERASRLGVEVRAGRDQGPWFCRRVVSQSSVSITGRVVVDLLPIIRSSYSLKQYTLRTAAMELLGQEKYDVDPKEMEAIWEAGGDELRRFISYARRDAVLALGLLLQLRLMDKYIALSRASGTLLQDVVNGGQSGMVESLLLRRFRERDRVVPPKPGSEESDERYDDSDELKGGAVLDPKKGLLEDVVILDYKSLYPTIMMAHNLCYSTVVTGQAPAGSIQAPSGGLFVPPEVSAGIVPGVLQELLEERTRTKKLMKTAESEDERRFLDAKQNAMKILLNSFYGYSGYARARLYSLAVANAVTSFGRQNILRTRDMIEQIGRITIVGKEAYLPDELKGPDLRDARSFDLSVVYGDTDSVFVKIVPAGGLVDRRCRSGRNDAGGLPQSSEVSLDDAELIGRKIAQAITSHLPPPMELIFEAFARRAIFLAKKRYALWVFEKGGQGWKERIKVRGMETVRRDWCELTSKTLNHCLELLLKMGQVEEAVEHVRTVIGRVQSMDIQTDSELLEDLTLTRRYTKNPSSYKSKQPHIQLVEKMRRRGGRVPGIGDRVPFVIVRGNRKTLFVDKAEDPNYAVEKNLAIDTDYYIEKQLLPPVLRIFSSFDIDRDRLIRGQGQCNLMDFGEGGRDAVRKQKSLFDY